MESDDDFQTFSSPLEAPSQSPVRERKLKRLKKAVRVSQEHHIDQNSSKSGAQDFQESDELLRSESGSEDLLSGSVLGSGLGGKEDVSRAKMALDFEAVGDEIDGKIVKDHSGELQDEGDDARVEELENRRPNSGVNKALDFEALGDEIDGEVIEDQSGELGDESEDARVGELEKKRPNPDEVKNKKKKKRRENGDFDGKPKDSTAIKRRGEKERRQNMKQLLAESQRLLRESGDAVFKPAPIVRKPISSVLEKIRQRKLEISKRSLFLTSASSIDVNDDFSRVVTVDCNIECVHGNEREDSRVSEATIEKTSAHPTRVENSVDGPLDVSNHSLRHLSCEKVTSKMAVDEEPKQTVRAPIDDTQDLYSDSQTSDANDDSQTSDTKDDLTNDTTDSPLEEVFAPSILAMNLKFDSAPPDDSSTDEEDNDKENVDPHPHGLADSSSPPPGDPVKAFVDDEAEEEDDSDNDLMLFQNNDEDEDEEDVEELKDMIATGFEEQLIDSEKRNELHQKWLEQQDAVGTENLLQKLKCGSKLRETTLLEEKEVEEGEEEGFAFEDTEDLVPSNVVQMNLRKIKQMIPQMFTENDNAYLSSDDEETERRLTKQCLLWKAEERATFLSPAEDENSKEVFGLIKKLNIMPSTMKRAKTPSSFDMAFMGGSRNKSSKSSFLGRGSTRCLLSSKKRGPGATRSFIFNEVIQTAEAPYQFQSDKSSEAIEKQNRPRAAPVKINSSQITKSTQKSSTATVAANPTTSLLNILRQTSLKSTSCPLDNTVTQTGSVLASFKLAKKPMQS